MCIQNNRNNGRCSGIVDVTDNSKTKSQIDIITLAKNTATAIAINAINHTKYEIEVKVNSTKETIVTTTSNTINNGT